MKKINTILVGLGRIGWHYHFKEILRHPGFNLVAVVDPEIPRLREAQTLCDARAYENLADCLKDKNADLVVIASPTKFHCEQVCTALSQGLDVFCDKPLATSLADVDKMLASMKSHGRKLMVYQPHRVSPETQAIEHVLREGLLGPIHMMGFASSSYLRRSDWQAFKKLGGGILMNYGAHFIDLLLYLTASPAASIYGLTRCAASLGDADDVAKIIIETEDSCILDIDLSHVSAIRTEPWAIHGKYGSMVSDEVNKEFLVRYVDPKSLPNSKANAHLAVSDRKYDSSRDLCWQTKTVAISDFTPLNYYQYCYGYFALNHPPFVPVSETREVMRLLKACSKELAR